MNHNRTNNRCSQRGRSRGAAKAARQLAWQNGQHQVKAAMADVPRRAMPSALPCLKAFPTASTHPFAHPHLEDGLAGTLLAALRLRRHQCRLHLCYRTAAGSDTQVGLHSSLKEFL